MYFAACIRPDQITVSPLSSIDYGDLHTQNTHIGINLFENKNYRVILAHLDSGYNDAIALIQSMEEYRNLLQSHINGLNIYSQNCISRLQRLSSFSAYPTTMEAQKQTYQSFETQATIIQERCNNIQQIIDRYNKQVNEIYQKPRFSNTYKHYRTDELKKLFKEERSPLIKVLDALKNLRAKEKTAIAAVQNSTAQLQNLNLDLSRSAEGRKLQEIQEDIVAKEEKRSRKEATYIEKATVIFQKCQQLERERLEQLKQTLNDFIREIHPSDYSAELVKVYEKLLLDIKDKQNISKDLSSCARTYGIHTLPSTTIPATTTNENVNDSATNS